MPDGHRYTVPAAQRLRQRLNGEVFHVFFDHGDATEAQTIVAWAGDAYEAPYRPKQLAHLDIAIVDSRSNRVICLIEIEDTTHNPKTLIGDLVAPMLSSRIAIGQKVDYGVDPSATLIVFAYFKTEQNQSSYKKRLAHIQDGVTRMQTALGDGWLNFGRCILDSFVDQDQLDRRLWNHVQSALTRYDARYS